MSHRPRFLERFVAICGMLCVTFFVGTNALAQNVTEKIVDGKRILIFEDEEYTEIRPQTVFRTRARKPAQKKQGYVVYQRKASDEVFENSAPRRGELTLALETLITAGEKRHVQFAIYAIRDLGMVRITVTDLVSAGGGRIDKKAIDVRIVKSIYRRLGSYRVHRVPHLLIQQKDAPAVKQDQSQQFWLTIAVPKNATASSYRGKITISAEKGGTADMELVVRVPDFVLAESMWWGMYYYGGWNGTITKRVFQDMRDHGMTGILYCDGKVEPVMKKVGDKVELTFPNADQCMPVIKELGFKDVIYYPRLLSNKLILLFGMEKGFKPHRYYGTKNVLYEVDKYPESLKPVLADLFRQIDAHAKQAGWPYPLIYYPVDEPRFNDAVMNWALLEMPILKQALPGARIFCTAYELNVIQKLLPWLDIANTTLDNLADKETNEAILAAAGKKGAAVWAILSLSPSNGYQGMRTNAGLLPEKGGATGMTMWTYYGPYEYTNEYDEFIRGNEGKSYAHAAPSYISRDGTLLPTVPWEAIREGINDSRYARTLKHWIAQARKSLASKNVSNNKRTQLALLADNAEVFLNATMDNIPWGEGAHEGKWTEPQADHFRQEAARHIQALKTAMQ